MSDIENRISWVFEADGSELTSELEKVQAALDGLGVTAVEDLDVAGQGASKSMGNLTDKALLAAGGIAAGVTAAAAFGVALIAVTQRVAESSRELEKMGVLSKSTGKSLRETSAAIETTKAALMATAGVVADFFGPAIRGLSRGLSVAALALQDVLAGETIKSFEEYARVVFKAEEAYVALNTETKKAKEGMSELDISLAEFADEARFLRTLGDAQTVSDDSGPAGALRTRIATEEAILELQREGNEERKLLASEEMEDREAMWLFRSGLDADLADQDLLVHELKLELLHVERDTEEENRELEMAGLLSQNELREKLHDAEMDRKKDERDLNNVIFKEAVKIIGSVLDVVKATSAENIAVQKGVALGEVALATAVGLANAFKDVNPITTPLKVAAVLAQSAASVAAILATSDKGGPRVKSGSGMDFGRASGGGGGPSRPGGDLGGGGTFIMLGNEVFDAQTRRALRRDSELDRAIRRRGGSQRRLGNAGDS